MEPTAHIPMIVRAPGIVRPHIRDTTIARNVDILPTVLALLEIPNPVEGDGLDLFAPRPPDTAAYIETYLSGTWLFADRIDPATDTRLGFRRLAIRTSQWKFVINDPIPMLDGDQNAFTDELHATHYTTQLFDVVADPDETINHALEQPVLAEELRLAIWREQSAETTASEALPMDATTRERLKALGYLSE